MSTDPLTSLLCSSMAALVARTLTHPLDTLKTRSQSSPFRHTYPSLAASIMRSESPSAFFRGLGVTLFFSVPAMSIYLTTYDELKRRLGHTTYFGGVDSLWTHALAGAGAEGISGLFWTPMEVLKTKLQMKVDAKGIDCPNRVPMVQRQPFYQLNSNTIRLAKDVYITFGIRGFYRGYLLSQAVFIPYTMIYFVTYEKLKQTWCNIFNATLSDYHTPSALAPSFTGYLVCSSLAGAVAGGATNAVDVVKTRVQLSSSNSTWRVIRTMWIKEGGLLAFTKGISARIIWVTPSMAISVTVYEILKGNRWLNSGIAVPEK
ncbi:hypothetical protein BASA50_006622 [Batrachochytrium salamandrivorans]|uniref:Mitochondrial carrier n=1 Tax=Batrachochytrium salamandrivorans TaxID=1357716 RepID=A0ABQ8F971_9FUNG|nr:hypothetical protein BASA60_000326 [Batrachochytrium salamandrivorans]KAH6594375.1 hypothetical protein BASA50_006622 [Batrachochytrium salamandrivorans]